MLLLENSSLYFFLIRKEKNDCWLRQKYIKNRSIVRHQSTNVIIIVYT